MKLIDKEKEFSPSIPFHTLGWGRLWQGGFATYILREVALDYVSTNTCQSSWHWVGDSQICTRSDQGKDTCQGDSGSIVFFKGENSDSDQAVGIVSFGAGCADGVPSVISSIRYYKDWLKQKTGYDFDQQSPDTPGELDQQSGSSAPNNSCYRRRGCKK